MEMENNKPDTLLVSPVFYALQSEMGKSKHVVLQGGESAGKTVNTLIHLTCQALNNSGTVTTVTSESLPHMKGGVIRDFELFIYPYFKPVIEHYNKTDQVIKFNNGSLFEFKAFDEEMKARGGRRDYLYVNEANAIPYNVFDQLNRRTRKQTIIDYNPSSAFWANEHLIGVYHTKRFIFDHRHNPFLSASDHTRIESDPDPESFRVYARGLMGNLRGTVYPSWKMVTESEFNDIEGDMIGGLDFGYTNDPTAGVIVKKHKGEFYVKQICYHPGIAPKEIITYFSDAGFDVERYPVYCDHDKEMISLLRRNGMKKALRARDKSVVNGVSFLRKKKINYTETSFQIHMERQKYVFINDKVTGQPTNYPIDRYNHLLDAIRYAIFSHFVGDSE